MKTSELLTELASTQALIEKGTQEVLTKIAELEAIIADEEVPQAVIDAVAAVKAAAQKVDDITPDAPPPPPPAE